MTEQEKKTPNPEVAEAIQVLRTGFHEMREEIKQKDALIAKLTEQVEEQETALEWRRLALQFDGHRMLAIWHLKAMVADPEEHLASAQEFLKEGPLSGEKVLEERILAMAKLNVPKGYALTFIGPQTYHKGISE